MKINNKHYRTVWMKGSAVKLINQQKLPRRFEIFTCRTHRETVRAIKEMIIRGAPAIGAAACYAYAQAVKEYNGDISGLEKYLDSAEELILSSRATAVDLANGVNFVKQRVIKELSKLKIRGNTNSGALRRIKNLALSCAEQYADNIVNVCKRIGVHGERLIKNNAKILTHCNAGALATVDIGTALAPIRLAHKNGKNIFVFVDETRPWLQGRLTSFELLQEGIPHAIIADNAAGYYMSKSMVDLVVVGADRIALNGDVANKIGTYEKAVLAKENKIPFYVAAPLSTIDLNCKTGGGITVEERPEREVLFLNNTRVAPRGARAKNPVFDITPAKYVTGIITEHGIINANKKAITELVDKTIG